MFFTTIDMVSLSSLVGLNSTISVPGCSTGGVAGADDVRVSGGEGLIAHRGLVGDRTLEHIPNVDVLAAVVG